MVRFKVLYHNQSISSFNLSFYKSIFLDLERLLENFDFINPDLCYELSVVFSDEKDIKKLNSIYRNKNVTTDILTFCTKDVHNIVDERIRDLGDIVICEHTIKKNSKEFDCRFKEELIRNLIHGVLHLFGKAHRMSYTSSNKEIFFQIQEKLLKEILLENECDNRTW